MRPVNPEPTEDDSAQERKRRQTYAEQCSIGDLEEITNIVNNENLSEGSLTEGLIAAVKCRSLEIIDLLLKRGAVVSSKVVLTVTLYYKSIEVLQLLIDHGWNINAPLFQNRPALLRMLDDEDIVRWFFDQGAELDHSLPFPPDVNYKRNLDPTSLYLNKAACCSTIAVFDMLLARGASKGDSIPLHKAASICGNDEKLIPMMAHLIDLGFDVNGTDHHARMKGSLGTPLHYSVRAKAVGKIKFLLSRGADPFKGVHSSSLELARRLGHEEIVATLTCLET